MKKTLSAITGLALAAAMVIAPLAVGAASAEEVPIEPAPAVVEQVAEAPAEATEPAPAEPVVEPTVEQVAPPVEEAAPAEPAPEAPAPEAKPEQPAPVVEDTSKTQPDFICDEDGDGWQAKVDWDGDGNPTVNAPEGFLIDAYCVKAGTTKHIVDVEPPAASVEIDHPYKDSVSHYQIHLVPIPDEPEVVLFTPPTYEDPCGPNNITFNLPDIEGVIWVTGQVGNVYTVEATLEEGYEFPEGTTQTVWKIKDYGYACPPVPPTVEIVIDCEAESNVMVTATNENDATVPVTLVVDFNLDGAPDFSEVLNVVPGETVLFYDFTEDTSVGVAVLYGEVVIFQDILSVDCVDDREEATLAPPVATDECGTENDFADLPEDTEAVDYEWASEDPSDLDVVAYVNEGFVVTELPEGWVSEGEGSFFYDWTYEFSDAPCDEGSLDGSFITPVCVDDAAYLTGTISVIDPDNQVPDDAEATITLSDGENSFTYPQTFPIGAINVLWPGASIDPVTGFGVTWPGYITNADGTYTATDDPAYYGWTRGGVTVTVEVNPEFSTTVDYPPASPLCLTSPPAPGTPGTPPTTGGLAVTGGPEMLPWGIGGLATLLAGASLMLIRRARMIRG